jgi:hypothetical protein
MTLISLKKVICNGESATMHRMTINAPIIREMSLLMLISATNAVMILSFVYKGKGTMTSSLVIDC